MPPRKRPPPPAKAPEAPPETKPKISPPAKPIAAAPPPPKAVLSDTVLAALSQHERPIYKLVFAGGDKGMSQTEIRIKTGMPTSTLTKHLRGLTSKGVLKVVNSVHKRAEKIYMDVRIDPSPEITGGTWYRNGQLDSDAVASARRRCLDQIDKLGVATAESIHEGISRECSNLAYSTEQVRDILRTMALDREVEEVRSTGAGEFGDLRAGRVCYRRGGPVQGGMMERIPCGVCPRIDECSPDGVISPSTCVYYKKWLQMDF
ncbi:DNA-directed RNA polymerase III subunit RPC6 isoform X1 [Oryza sativa Japonica Group]|jgi:DNA-directed RNA polymerase III subunit RPC6|uniref:DNA-directed RNA polymerase III subunit RPC6 n=2 Tax=Oryza sativa subsp. japonica TaxID=39947 RepID=Q69XJ1_ORYSJ|nr:DNA-directed RNA polymerase III subunit RPC6 [Oryza sativa Japonica Group]XP_015641056.1 DNA-directed RNA polymerase III subunit RPC6 [Oryza sativa Japonica Group]XP_015641059.1 DNA-directed RNA polymerase III subunit RPC6 [Oryza sativa Japonica Group]XP_015641060.1 DNA-directed RNA polymerase III subunit RPC6 [Oryza sativa Japonica Group]XP_025882062.1 DNA-directed RNA polymerase III subunit RPC6 [Oryza sativa Japonica Group]XP_025882063.1 DNA-directed RNA polymerase III subunit RPC6 [Oryz